MDYIDKLIDASQAPAWRRYMRTIAVSYRTKHTQDAFNAGFAAGLEFARLAVEQEGEPDE